MQLAFIDNLPVGGGLARFSVVLCRSLIKQYPSLHLDYFAHHSNIRNIQELRNLERVKIYTLKKTLPLSASARVFKKVQARIYKSSKNENEVLKEIETRIGSSYDLAYFPSAHMHKRPELAVPIVGTIHDFNWKYFFGRQIFNRKFVDTMDHEIVKWLNKGLTICSSQFIADEARALYPSMRSYPVSVPIGPVVVHTKFTRERNDAILKQMGVTYPYIIFPGNFYPHKNHLNLFTAFSLLKKRQGFHDLKLILTGMDSDQVSKGIAEYRGIRLTEEESCDVFGMGYQPDEVIDVLIANARLLVSPSIYEAICTPGMDAWSFATPTAISDITPFREHEQVLGIKSAFFDPMDPKNIADVIEAYLNNYEQAKEDAKISKKKMAEYSWAKVAEKYMNVFEQAILKN